MDQKQLIEILEEASLLEEVEDEVIFLITDAACSIFNGRDDEVFEDPDNTWLGIWSILYLDPTVDVETSDKLCEELNEKYSSILIEKDISQDGESFILITSVISNTDELTKDTVLETIKEFDIRFKEMCSLPNLYLKVEDM